ncbi:hypothetical protein LIER_36698 [Lithospermum erythrorhizon]|uniref:Reverse transcriptase domain-containing protein n=1 Tax=Lithospermum erythrorhizon TaxID=34254 RepID=A0AAV3PDT6_LITER
MTHFRPIALCNTVAKVIAKTMAMRLKNILPTIISETQSAFVPNRLIKDNVLLSYEVHHFIKHKKTGKDGYMSIKLEMMKAYDRIEWSFLKAMIQQLNFSHKWINLIMDYVTLVSSSVLINGNQSGFFRPGRGLRQGINFGENTTTFSHLMFANDTLLLGRASVTEARILMRILKHPNVSEELKVAITDILEMAEVTTHGKYLGLPTSLGTSKKDFYSSLIDRVKAKVEGWKSRLLSKAEQKKSIHWSSWSTLSNTKPNGGLGFRDLMLFNMAKYFPQGSFWTTQIGPIPSYTWKSLIQVREFLCNTIDWEVGDGTNIHSWKHRWVQHTWSKKPYTTEPTTITIHQLSKFIDPEVGIWALHL